MENKNTESERSASNGSACSIDVALTITNTAADIEKLKIAVAHAGTCHIRLSKWR